MKFIGFLILIRLAVLVEAMPLDGGGPSKVIESPRSDIVLDTGWRFIQANVKGAEATEFDDSSWESVKVPHCWNVESGQKLDKANFYEGPGWYRLHLKPDASTADKSLFLKFDAAYHSADVFLNGKLVGSHVGGFTAFCFDVTGLLKPGQDNVLAVKVSYQAPIPSIPLSGDYTKYPGLYRNVHLIVLSPVSISPLDDASSGVYLNQLRVDDAEARVEVTAKLRNGSTSTKKVMVRCRIRDAGGMEVTNVSVETQISGRGLADSVQTVMIAKPRLWNGRLDPYLYQAEVEVLDEGVIVDRITRKLGLRAFRATADQGFVLNGKPYRVHGVSYHQDRFDKGWAITKADMAQDLSLLEEMGCTGLRLAHYPHSDTFLELCDKAGMVVWAELPLIGGGWVAKDIDDPDGKIGSAGGTDLKSTAFRENALQQLTEMIKQGYNHPSIAFWSIWNEIGSPKSEPDKAFLKSLNLLAKQLDPTRPTTAASADDKNRITDVVGRNGYFGWYGGTPDDWNKLLPEMLEKANGRAFIISEYGAGGSVLHHQVNPSNVSPKGKWHPEEWQALIHERAWNAFVKVPNLTATFAWLGFDFSTMLRNEGDHPGRNDKGLITADRKVCKDSYYFYKANWNPEPMCYITSRRFTPRPSGVTSIKVYSNCHEVDLRVNGKSQGSKKESENGIYVWENVVLPEGKTEIEVISKQGGKEVKDQCVWECLTSAPPKLDLSRPREPSGNPQP